MRIVEPLVGLLSNLEVLRVLHERGAGGQVLGTQAPPSEKMVYNYIAQHSAGLRDESAIKDFVALMAPFQLSKLEVLGIINTCPTSTVEMYLLVENCDERLTEQQVEQILNLVAMHLHH